MKMSSVGKSNRGRKSTLTVSAKKRSRRQTLANYQKTRINVGHQYDRWMELKVALHFEAHAEAGYVRFLYTCLINGKINESKSQIS
jgi:hypothetical protein